jgi:metal-responsive CopG/Arc/MetJ family transcriptional regulator
MRTTITIEDELLEQCRRLAAQSGRSLSRVIQDAVRDALASKSSIASAGKSRKLTTSGTPDVPGLRPGVHINRTAEFR